MCSLHQTMKLMAPKEEWERDEAEKGKACLPKFALPQPFDETMKETKSFISVRARPSKIPKRASCGLYKNSGSDEMRLMG